MELDTTLTILLLIMTSPLIFYVGTYVSYGLVIWWNTLVIDGPDNRRFLEEGSVLDPDGHEWYHWTDKGIARRTEIQEARKKLKENEQERREIVEDYGL